jgi:hypothetical protein
VTAWSGRSRTACASSRSSARTRSPTSSRAALAGKEILDELSRANEIVGAKATPEEAEAFRAWILECAQRAADAAKEGGFLGFHAERVSQGEKGMLAQLESTLGTSAA